MANNFAIQQYPQGSESASSNELSQLWGAKPTALLYGMIIRGSKTFLAILGHERVKAFKVGLRTRIILMDL